MTFTELLDAYLNASEDTRLFAALRAKIEASYNGARAAQLASEAELKRADKIIGELRAAQTAERLKLHTQIKEYRANWIAEECKRIRLEAQPNGIEPGKICVACTANDLDTRDRIEAMNTRLWKAVKSARDAVSASGLALAQLAANRHLPTGEDGRRWWDDAVGALDDAAKALDEPGDIPDAVLAAMETVK